MNPIKLRQALAMNTRILEFGHLREIKPCSTLARKEWSSVNVTLGNASPSTEILIVASVISAATQSQLLRLI
jgi:hypothetical protein